jgi:hypothetical protein
MEIANVEKAASGHLAQAPQNPSVPVEAPAPRAPSPVSAAAGDAEKHQLASVQALVAGLRGDFAEIGIVPPPKKYAGLDVVSQGEIAQAKSDEASTRVGSLDRMRIIMVRNILARLANEQAGGETEAPEASSTTPHVNLAL